MSHSYKIGDIVKGEVTGIQAYGVFVTLDSQTQGLIHISECAHGYIQNVSDFIKVGARVTAKVIDVDEYTKKISLSLRALDKSTLPHVTPRRRRRRQSYNNQIGFQALADKLPQWIEEAQQHED